MEKYLISHFSETECFSEYKSCVHKVHNEIQQYNKDTLDSANQADQPDMHHFINQMYHIASAESQPSDIKKSVILKQSANILPNFWAEKDKYSTSQNREGIHNSSLLNRSHKLTLPVNWKPS